MFSVKNSMAYLLLWVYGVSFGHQIIPHHHHEANDKHHFHVTGIDREETDYHAHVAHQNHFDEGFIDYLACVLGNHEHNPATECELTNEIKSQRVNPDVEHKLAVIPAAFSVPQPLIFKTAHKPTLTSHNPIKWFYSGKTGKRGPPLV